MYTFGFRIFGTSLVCFPHGNLTILKLKANKVRFLDFKA
ncbi:hypothetical protein TERMP_00674 [Thermococcus barophilus MP]|uniref:Uncharacterized protein n=1 Tax=Thermococcus barophilus (strain DSM 11836 / MP) TaxID=391623 RepID=F0LKS2_THEBM|nr:hypothetical protein TERMP_00674 [Thermococcus barophilus MP]